MERFCQQETNFAERCTANWQNVGYAAIWETMLRRIIRELSVYSDVPLLPGKTLIIFDEIQQLIQLNDKIVPVEVKAENAISGRSLDVYNEKFKPETRIRFSMLNLQMNGGLLSCPAPLAEWAAKWC